MCIRNAGLKNNFTPKTRQLFAGVYTCWVCGQTQKQGACGSWENVNALHHIKGRVSASPLGACPIHNTNCHLYNPRLTKQDMQRQLLQRTLRFLLGKGYVLTSQDRAFVLKYKQDYEAITYGND